MLQEFLVSFASEAATQVGVWAGAAVGGAAVYYVGKILAKIKAARYKRMAALSSLNGLDLSAYRYLAELMVSTGADRAYIIQFHNGTYYLNSSGQVKMSCTHEMVKEGVSKEQSAFQNLLTSHYPVVINTIINSVYDAVIILPTEGDNRYSQLLIERGTHTHVLCPLRRGDILEGYVAIDFVADKPDLEEAELKKVIRNYTSKIGFILRGANL